MSESGSSLKQRALAILVLAVALWILMKFVIGIITSVATILVVVLAVGAVIWALRIL